MDILQLSLHSLQACAHQLSAPPVLLLPAIAPREPARARALDAFRRPEAGSVLQRAKLAYWELRTPDRRTDRRREVLGALGHFQSLRVFEYASTEGLGALAVELGLDAVLLSTQDLGATLPVPWVGYLTDVQHRHLPHLFDPSELQFRDRIFASILAHADAMIATSVAVRDDIARHFGRDTGVVVVPFATLPHSQPQQSPPSEASVVLRRYGVDGRYFIVCNQFWKHKSHLTAVNALHCLHGDSATVDVALVCTGLAQDYRDPTYFDSVIARIRELGLGKRVQILGRIPKDDQIVLLRNSIALIQPSLFEGTRGGLAVADAIGAGVPAIVSDIAVNQELDDGLVTFFAAADVDSLASAMRRALNADRPRVNPQATVARDQARLVLFGQALLSACLDAVAARKAAA